MEEEKQSRSSIGAGTSTAPKIGSNYQVSETSSVTSNHQSDKSGKSNKKMR